MTGPPAGSARSPSGPHREAWSRSTLAGPHAQAAVLADVAATAASGDRPAPDRDAYAEAWRTGSFPRTSGAS